jgi:hypothetical protein
MPRIHESLTPQGAGSNIASGIVSGAPLPSEPASSEGPPVFAAPASQGTANYLTGGFLELDPGPPSKKASGEGSWNGGAITPLAGSLGGDASLRAELEGYHMPETSEPQEGLPRGREGQGGDAAEMYPPAHPAHLEKPLASEVGKTHGGGPPPGVNVVQPRRDNAPGTRLFNYRGYTGGG